MIRLFDVLFSVIVLILFAPLLLAVAFAIKMSSPGPVLYLADRMGKCGQHFCMFKFRSMDVDNKGSEITATNDARVFAIGRVIRKWKLDELPQFVNVLLGDMAIVGPRPESPAIVERYYKSWMHETLSVLPGITSPGAIFYYSYGNKLLDAQDPETSYAEKLLAPKLALDLAYAERETFFSNLFVIGHTVVTIIGKAVGKTIGPLPRDLERSQKWYDASGN